MARKLTEMDCWEGDEDVPTPRNQYNFLLQHFEPQDLARMLRVPAQYVSFWLHDEIDEEFQPRLQLVYQVVKACLNYAGENRLEEVLHKPYVTHKPVRAVVAEEQDDAKMLEKVRDRLLESARLYSNSQVQRAYRH